MRNLFKTITRKTIESNLPNIIKNYSGKKILEIGPGNEEYKVHMERLKIYQTLDIDDKFGKPNHIMDIHKCTLKSESYDTVIAIEVLEHLYNPFLAIENVYKLLKTNGVFIGTTRFIYPYHGEPYDYFRFTEHGLREIFKNFKNVKIITLGNRFASIADLLSTSNKLFKLLRVFTKPISFNNRKSKAPLGFIFIAEK